jgi:hypothetical protein
LTNGANIANYLANCSLAKASADAGVVPFMKRKRIKQQTRHWLQLPQQGSDITDEGWEEFEPRRKLIWQQASALLSSKTYNSGPSSIRASLDWKPALRSQARYYRFLRDI